MQGRDERFASCIARRGNFAPASRRVHPRGVRVNSIRIVKTQLDPISARCVSLRKDSNGFDFDQPVCADECRDADQCAHGRMIARDKLAADFANDWNVLGF